MPDNQPVERNLSETLKVLEAVEANLIKAERVWTSMRTFLNERRAGRESIDYDGLRRSLAELVSSLPAIDSFRPATELPTLSEIDQARIEASDVGTIGARSHVEDWINQPGRHLDQYRFRFDRKRRGLLRRSTLEVMREVDRILAPIDPEQLLAEHAVNEDIPPGVLEPLRNASGRLETLLGSSIKRPPRWGDFRRHLYFGQMGDLRDIAAMDWPAVRSGLEEGLYGEDEPLPVPISDLAELTEVNASDRSPIRLDWSRLESDEFERLIFALLQTDGYENPQWLMPTNAADRGRDLSVQRVSHDRLSGSRRERVIVQCKHWRSRSIGVADLSTVREQLRLWEPPRVDVLILATSGRFSSDAVQWVERHNLSDSALRIEMWPESHLESLLAARPGVIADFGLR